jgi:nicotinamidase-related amidase
MLERTPARTAPIIVIDLQTGMFDGNAVPPVHDADGLVGRVRDLLAWARREGRAIAFIRHDDPAGEPLAPGAPGNPVWPALGQAAGEPTFGKTVGDAFSNPALGAWLAEHGTGEVILLGAQSDRCVAATVKGALQSGLRVTVVADAHSTWAFGDETAKQIIARKNAEFAAAGATLVTTRALTGG